MVLEEYVEFVRKEIERLPGREQKMFFCAELMAKTIGLMNNATISQLNEFTDILNEMNNLYQESKEME